MKRTEFDVAKGKAVEVPLSEDEQAELAAKREAHAQAVAQRAARRAAMTVEQKLAAVGLTVGDIKEAVRKGGA